MGSPVKDKILAEYESPSGRLSRKIQESPFMPVGLVGLAVACGIGAYNFKNRGGMSPSVYLMRLRVIAQGTVVGCLALGISYAMFKEYVWKPNDVKKTS